MTLEELYDTRRGVADADAVIAGWSEAAAAFRERWRHKTLDVAYGPRPRNDVDLFWPDDARDNGTGPMVVLIHGGYWQRWDRAMFSHLAEGLVRKGVAVALPSYTLAPEVPVAEIVEDARRCVRFLHQTYKRPLTAIGHSAGAHLAATLFATDWPLFDPALPPDLVRSGFGLSGIYDLAPLLETSINGVLALERDGVRAVSPLHALPPALRRFDVWVGKRESTAFHEQSRRLQQRWSMLGTPVRMHFVPNSNHFEVVAPLANPRSRMVKRVLELVHEPELVRERDDGEARDEGEEEVAAPPVDA